ncbi:MAG TPA: hypothetical protein VLE24_03375 [Methyloceanibacter sp.]|nr:hypothetical protein [Methyloceanibacter sp.]
MLEFSVSEELARAFETAREKGAAALLPLSDARARRDGFIYLLMDEAHGMLARLEPAS